MAYDLDEATAHVAASDSVMAAVVERAGPCLLQVGHLDNPFQSLLKSIVYQQLNGKAAGTIYQRVLDLFPGEHPDPEELLATSDDALRAQGLSRNKTAAVKDLAANVLRGTVPGAEALYGMGNAEIIDRLTAVRGIGPWTVEMLLIFQLGRPDVLPVTDYGVRNGFRRAYGLEELPTPSELRAEGERWRPYRSVASWYLWRAADMDLF